MEEGGGGAGGPLRKMEGHKLGFLFLLGTFASKKGCCMRESGGSHVS